MTSRLMILCWLAALAIVGAVGMALSQPVPRPPADIPDADIVFIGTSLTRAAIAQYDGAETTVAPGKTHFRLGLLNAEPQELLALFDEAIARKPELVVLEIDHFLFEFDHRRTDTWRGKALQSLASRRKKSLERIRHLLGAKLLYEQRLELAKHAFVAPPGVQDISAAHLVYPLHIRRSLSFPDLVERVERAKREGVEVALLLAPRSATGLRFAGSGTSWLLAEESQRVAQELNVDLISFGTGWNDGLYSDLGHLNSRGQERFMNALRHWFQTQI